MTCRITRLLHDEHRRLYRTLYGYLRGMKVPHAEIDDLIQETMLAALTGRERFRGRCRPETWVVAIARVLACSRYRKQRVRRKFHLRSGESVPREPQSCAASPEMQLAVQELEDALVHLSSNDQTLFRLRYYAGHQPREIAGMLGFNAAYVSRRIHKIKERLKEKLRALVFGPLLGAERRGREIGRLTIGLGLGTATAAVWLLASPRIDEAQRGPIGPSLAAEHSSASPRARPLPEFQPSIPTLPPTPGSAVHALPKAPELAASPTPQKEPNKSAETRPQRSPHTRRGESSSPRGPTPTSAKPVNAPPPNRRTFEPDFSQSLSAPDQPRSKRRTPTPAQMSQESELSMLTRALDAIDHDRPSAARGILRAYSSNYPRGRQREFAAVLEARLRVLSRDLTVSRPPADAAG